ncbi:hypothetical protein GHV41_25900 [Serratia proteamaculans]|uniref:Uncharacterized protein n=2 Tax=Serratia TaxID=613 RepID=A0A5Q2VJH5_SERPR|nr:hypothetical protein GHV41_25900 [Serratia proteamaculans]
MKAIHSMAISQAAKMKHDDQNSDDTFSALLKVLAVVVIAIFIIAVWYFI